MQMDRAIDRPADQFRPYRWPTCCAQCSRFMIGQAPSSKDGCRCSMRRKPETASVNVQGTESTDMIHQTAPVGSGLAENGERCVQLPVRWTIQHHSNAALRSQLRRETAL